MTRKTLVAMAALTFLPLHASAVIMPRLDLSAPAPTSLATRPVSQSLSLLQKNPTLIETLGLSEEDKNALYEQIVNLERESDSNSVAIPNEPIVQKVFLDKLWNGMTGQNPTPQYAPNPRQPLPPVSEEQPARKMNVPKSPAEPQISFNHESMKDLNDWKVKFFDVVIVINKASNAQTVMIYEKAAEDQLPKVIAQSRVSTGRETPEYSNADRLAMGRGESDHAPKNTYFSNTPQGYYSAKWLNIAHISGDWEDAAMDHAVFFDINRGIATHRAPGGTEKHLGQRASGACVRMSASFARTVFWKVRGTGGPITEQELMPDRKERSVPGPSFAKEYKIQLEKGFTTYPQAPLLPDFTRDGRVNLDASGAPLMVQGKYRTLIVVENRPLNKVKTASISED